MGADQRYYSSQLGRFMTPDPAAMRAADPANPVSWNRYSYVKGDPVNSNDPSGLDPEGAPGTTCFMYGTWWSGAMCDFAMGFGPSGRGQSPFQTAVNRLGSAADAIQARTAVSSDCQKDLDALSAAAGKEISLDAIQTALSNTNFANGTTASLPVSALYGPGVEDAGRAYQWQQDRLYGPGQTIANEFGRNPNGLTAETVLLGSTIFINSALIGNNLGNNEALLFHEVLHEFGLVDTSAQEALGITVDSKNTKNITDKLHKDCFTGKGNRN